VEREESKKKGPFRDVGNTWKLRKVRGPSRQIQTAKKTRKGAYKLWSVNYGQGGENLKKDRPWGQREADSKGHQEGKKETEKPRLPAENEQRKG